MASEQDSFDFVIVGAGSAGCVLANRLSTDPGNRVLLIEAGGPDSNPWIHIPVGYFKTMHNPATDWCFKCAPDPGLGGRALNWPRGKVLGGSSSINGLLYIRGQPEDFDTWRQLGNAGWSWQDVLPYFKKSEDQELGADAHHGSGGELAVSEVRGRSEICDAIIAGAGELGIPPRADFNGEEQEGAGYFQTTTRRGRRCSTAVGFLKPVRHRANLEVVTNALVEKVLIEEGRARGVVFGGKTGRRQVRARREVILSAGAIGSPQLLMLSGIGPGAQLQEHGIEVAQDLPGVGANLQDHLQIRTIYKCSRPITLNDRLRNPLNKIPMALEYLLFRSGPLTMAASHVCIFARSSPAFDRPDLQYHVQPWSADSPGEGTHRFSAFTLSTCQLRPESRGRIALTSPDPTAHPAIHPNYLSTATDQRSVIEALKLTRRLVATEALKPYVAAEYLPGPAVQSEAEMLEAAQRIAQTIYHPTGTCKMGSDPAAVVDARLLVHGVQGLRVVDASIMPNITSGNTNAPTIMIAEKASDMILEDAD